MTTAAAPAVRVERRLLAGSPDGRLDTHLRTGGRWTPLDAPQLIELLRAAGLTGHGGAGFPAWRKLAAVHAARRTPVVIANGAEGEPASGKDKALLSYQPHLVLDGLQLLAGALRASAAHVYVQAASVAAVQAALAERRRAGLDPVAVTVHTASDAFVSGEESAVVAAICGRPAVPADKRARIVEHGLGGAPTLVQNVETLAHIAQIARYGPRWFASAGTPDEPGTFLATVGGAVVTPGVVEAGYGVRLGDLLDAAGGATGPLQAVLVGGYHGGWVPPQPGLPISRAALSSFGAAPGAGVVLALPSGVCGLAETARITEYLAGQVAGQCGPCLNGLPRLAGTLSELAGRRARPGLPAEVERLSALVTGRGACRHPDGTARLIRSGLRAFEADIAAHLAGYCLATRGAIR